MMNNYLHIVWSGMYVEYIGLNIRPPNRSSRVSIDYPVPGPRVTIASLAIL